MVEANRIFEMWRVLNRRLRKLSLLLLFCIVTFIFYSLLIQKSGDIRYQYITKKLHNNPHNDEATMHASNYLLYSKKCHMISMSPNDSSIQQFVKKEKFESCSPEPLLSSISRKSNGKIYLVIDNNVAKNYDSLSCCWARISRPKGKDIDSTISVGLCQNFNRRVLLNRSVEVVYVNCTAKVKMKNKTPTTSKITKVYENVHAVINPELVKKSPKTKHQKPLSVLMLGIDSVSRLNFHRTMPLTRAYFEKHKWNELRGYNKMGDNTFPNLMAILTGHNETWVEEKCKTEMDNCSIIWYNFRKAGYVTAFAEDHSMIHTFNYLKAGFVNPPTTYYFRPYILAADKLLKSHTHSSTEYSWKYCTGPELSADRIFNVAVDFSKTFIDRPHFGLFWTNTVSHEHVNEPSLYDKQFLAKLRDMESHGVMNETMVVAFSDHGMRFGDPRDNLIGWYEERLPFVYVWLPEWFREQNPDVRDALIVNQNRLVSPYDLYETLRDVLQRGGGQAPASTGCPQCLSLFKPVPFERGCRDAGIPPHWCTCADFEMYDVNDPIVVAGAQKFVEHMNGVVKDYKDENGTTLCAELRLKRIIQVKRLIDLDEDTRDKSLKLFYKIEVSPGGGKFETLISYDGSGEYTIRDSDVSRINIYLLDSLCLKKGNHKYCYCRQKQKI